MEDVKLSFCKKKKYLSQEGIEAFGLNKIEVKYYNFSANSTLKGLSRHFFDAHALIDRD